MSLLMHNKNATTPTCTVHPFRAISQAAYLALRCGRDRELARLGTATATLGLVVVVVVAGMGLRARFVVGVG